MPQLAQTLRNTVKTGNTLVDRQAALNGFLKDVSSFSETAKGFLDTNGENLIQLGKLSKPQVALLRQYSPIFPCLLQGLVDQVPMLASTFRGFVFHINLELVPKQPRGYHTGDKPVYGATNGPNCAGLPHPAGGQERPYDNAPNIVDGVDDHGGSLGRGDNQRVAPGFGVYPGGTAEQRALVNSLTAPALDVPVDEVPGITTLLFGPLAAGTTVSAR
jgi:phospholipid/cholesterol/gamma-HCH transport system substrate-binding protein